jgi:hypothetical protein
MPSDDVAGKEVEPAVVLCIRTLVETESFPSCCVVQERPILWVVTGCVPFGIASTDLADPVRPQ